MFKAFDHMCIIHYYHHWTTGVEALTGCVHAFGHWGRTKVSVISTRHIRMQRCSWCTKARYSNIHRRQIKIRDNFLDLHDPINELHSFVCFSLSSCFIV